LTDRAPTARKVRAALRSIMIWSVEEEQITTAPGLKFLGWEGRTGVGCTAAEETVECTSILL